MEFLAPDHSGQQKESCRHGESGDSGLAPLHQGGGDSKKQVGTGQSAPYRTRLTFSELLVFSVLMVAIGLQVRVMECSCSCVWFVFLYIDIVDILKNVLSNS